MKYFLFIIFLTAFVSCNKFETSICENGYLYENGNCEDINECTNGDANCPSNKVCINTKGSFSCECKTGFEGDGKSCEDIDECLRETHNCSTGFICENTKGSFICEDNDECVLETHNCSTGFTCENTIGSFTCEDINECENGTNNCQSDKVCINIAGSFICDIDECTNGTANCQSDKVCINTIGSFICDIDECLNKTDNCDEFAICINTESSFTCTCNSGFTGNGVTCISIMDIYEVTVGEFRQCVTAGSCTSSNYQTDSQNGYCNLNKPGKETHPMNCVNWFGADEYCRWKGKRLPTETEWEFAARGGENYIYSGSNDAYLVAWYSSNSGNTTHQVGTKAVNGYGLHDMSGNVKEWTNSWYDSSNSQRVLRGGSFDSSFIRVDYRSYREPTLIYYDSGFRCVQ